MFCNQHTLSQACSFEGKGLHTGARSRMTLLPAPAGHGIRFCRTDLPGRPLVDALAENVTQTARSTTLSTGTAQAMTVEHVLSALTGLGVDNALIELDNAEVPILDGSARPYVEAITRDGLLDQGGPRVCIDIPYALEIKHVQTGSWIRIEPAGEPSADITVDFGSRVLGIQKAHWDASVDYAGQIGICRTFCFFHEIEALSRNNLIKGGDVDNAIVVVEHPVNGQQLASMQKVFGRSDLQVTGSGYLNNLELQFPDECGRHKLLDLLGDLRLAGGFLNARITAFKPGHTLNTKAAKALRSILK